MHPVQEHQDNYINTVGLVAGYKDKLNMVTIKLAQHKLTHARQIPQTEKIGECTGMEVNPQPSACKADAQTTRIPAPTYTFPFFFWGGVC